MSGHYYGHLETVVPTAPEAQMLAVFLLSLARLEIVTRIGTSEVGGCVACLKGKNSATAKKLGEVISTGKVCLYHLIAIVVLLHSRFVGVGQNAGPLNYRGRH